MSALSPALLAWIEGITGSPVTDVHELTGGASRNSYILSTRDNAKSFLRLDAGHGPLSGTAYTLGREYGALAQLQGKGLKIAKVYAFSPEHSAMLMEFLPGNTSYQKTGTAQEEAALRRELMQAVVSLQQVDPRQVSALGAAAGAPLREAIPPDLIEWRRLYHERATIRDPLIDFALNWLTHAMPDPAMPSVIVHGDVGPGNFLINDGRISALIDWEMVRLGHPLEDVACIIARALGAPFGEAREHVENYQKLTGTTVDYAKLDYALALVLTRWLVAMLGALSRPSALQNVPMLFAFRQINGMSLIEVLCRAYGVALTDDPVTFRGSDPCRSVLQYSTETLGSIAGSSGVPADSYKLRGITDLLAYLHDFIDYGPERYEREENDYIARLTGTPARDAAEANQVICRFAREEDERRPSPGGVPALAG